MQTGQQKFLQLRNMFTYKLRKTTSSTQTPTTKEQVYTQAKGVKTHNEISMIFCSYIMSSRTHCGEECEDRVSFISAVTEQVHTQAKRRKRQNRVSTESSALEEISHTSWGTGIQKLTHHRFLLQRNKFTHKLRRGKTTRGSTRISASIEWVHTQARQREDWHKILQVRLRSSRTSYEQRKVSTDFYSQKRSSHTSLGKKQEDQNKFRHLTKEFTHKLKARKDNIGTNFAATKWVHTPTVSHETPD